MILLFAGQIFAAPQAVYKNYFGTGRTSYLDFVRSQNLGESISAAALKGLALSNNPTALTKWSRQVILFKE